MDNEYYFKLTDEGGTPAPSGEIVITANGTYDVTDKASAVVNVGGGVTGEIPTLFTPIPTPTITENEV